MNHKGNISLQRFGRDDINIFLTCVTIGLQTPHVILPNNCERTPIGMLTGAKYVRIWISCWFNLIVVENSK